jgi:hypothetical protein
MLNCSGNHREYSRQNTRYRLAKPRPVREAWFLRTGFLSKG